MKDTKLTITINCSPKKLFDYTLNPKNTSKWIDFIEKEETNEWPVKIGTIYKNVDNQGHKQELKITELVDGETFTMANLNSPYNVRYSFASKSPNATDLEYYEWVDNGELDGPFSMSH